MQEVFENIIEKLEKKVETAKRIMVPEIHDELDRIANETAESFIEAYKESIEIVKQVVAEYNTDGEQHEKPKTNADRIRSMSDEELAEFLCKVKADYQWLEHEFPSEEDCGIWEEWLQSEVEE